ncbi:EH domain-containing protein, putative [Candida dubliniensis CD36]|uniref:Actin cytoskeleton-regulatory complex protein END3 n=1 Tax=Candida dubliniensis (strain CD36 / ATCC MYA-646 / CBS 7987 / NCPF 3949 / NRRL Y-17841) TaxID=573826 RepID=B9WDB1_CANDC|nr:EH domain-containing protein, putative [Candida dubliniensis CD36]CAX42663.1 EH domain-containing protein, putative [Candida dubliniensis CD36]
MPRLEESEIKKYWQIFQSLKPENNKLTGDQLSSVLKNSQLPQQQLSAIWELSDIDNDGKLDFEEFCIIMRLIFDVINGKLPNVPSELPSWLIPASKSAIIQANKAVNQGNNNFGNDGIDDDLDDDDKLSNDFDWYISPTDKSIYEKIYDSKCDSFGRIKYSSLNELYNGLTNVPNSEISSAWNLINPKSFETIDKDQTLIFLHILNQRENGKRIPRGVPASLRATFSKEVPNYDLSAQVKPSISTTTEIGKKSFAENYLNKIGGGQNTIINNGRNEKGTDFSATQGTDWEEVRLRRELQDLEKLLDKVQNDTINHKHNNNNNNTNGDNDMLIKYEFEQLLKYKQDQLNSTASTKNNSNNSTDLSSIKQDIEEIQNQVNTLQEYLTTKNQELLKLNQQIESLK